MPLVYSGRHGQRTGRERGIEAGSKTPCGRVYSERQRNGKPWARLLALLESRPCEPKAKNIPLVLLIEDDQL